MSHFIPWTWWPAAALLAPVALPLLAARYPGFRRGQRQVTAVNRQRSEGAAPIDLEPVEQLELVVLVEWRAEPGFRRDPGVSYLIRTDRGSVLYDAGYGPATPTFSHNVRALGIDLADVSALAISHLHLDHMGGLRAQRTRHVSVPMGAVRPAGRPCYLPDQGEAPAWQTQVITEPTRLAAGLATPGPLARELFWLGRTEEISLVARLEGRGLVVFTGCGHPGLRTILDQVARIFSEPVHAFVGGLHLPLTAGRGFGGLPLQRIIGTGVPPWRVLDDDDVDEAVAALRRHQVRRLLLSAHDSCDAALAKLAVRSGIDTTVLSAGATYRW